MAPGVDEYDADDLEDYAEDYEEGGEELSPEDQASMAQGTEDVKKSLGSDASKVTVKQIQEALWHYYYDVEKSVGYLRRTFIAPPPKPAPKKAPEGTFNAVSFHAGLGSFEEDSEAYRERPAAKAGFHGCSRFPSLFPPLPSWQAGSSLDAIDFSDMPWLHTPLHRQAVLVEPSRPRGGLLGGGEGGPKMSKLQALAAARKKKNDDSKKDKDKTSQAAKGIHDMTISDDKETPSSDPELSQSLAKRQKLSGDPKSRSSEIQPASTGSQDTEKEKMMPLDEVDEIREESHGSSQAQVDMPSSPLRTAPSAFAQTLFGPASQNSRAQSQDVFAMPYASSSSFLATAFSEPSPDDVVLAAQAKAGKKTTPQPKAAKNAEKNSNGNGKEADVSNGLANLKVSEVPTPKSKGIDVIKEFEQSNSKRSLSFVVVGHVDAGKSTLMGRLLVDLKFVEERTVDKFRRLGEKTGKQSFAFAWVMDQRSEERDRGVTIDIATNHFETSTTKFTILDAPGHKDFVPNMIAGASQADFAIVVIDANTGAYEKGLKGQTREHVLLLRSLGVQRLIIAVNKLDMVGWSQERFDEISQQIVGFLVGLGFQEKHISFVPISGLNGDNITKKIENTDAKWYTGPTLIEALEDSGPSSARALKRPFRMTISEVFRSPQGTSTLAGRVDSGTIQLGEVLFVQPSGETAYIKSIAVDAQAQDWAVAGQSVTLTLTNIEPQHIRVGDILCHTTDPVPSGDEFTMKAMAFEHLMPMPVDIHRGRLHAAGQIQSIAATIDKATGEVIKKRPKVVQPGGVARVKIKLDAKVPLEAGQRVVIRSSGETIAAGLVE